MTKISADPDSPHCYAKFPQFWDVGGFRNAFIILDGEFNIRHAREADTEEGWVDFFPEDLDGKYRLSEDGSEVLTERLEGKIEIRWLPAGQRPEEPDYVSGTSVRTKQTGATAPPPTGPTST